MTWKLWHALRHPPTRNPLFRRAYVAPEQPAPWYIGCFQWVGVLFFLPVIAFAALIYGIGWSVGISNLIGRERTQRSFDLISLCPSGPLGMSWAIATGYLYHHRTFKNVNAPGNLYSRVALMAIFIAMLGLLVSRFYVDDFVFVLGLHVLALAFALYIDHVQSLLVTVLTGMVAPALAENRFNAQLYAFGTYMGVQLATYLVTSTVGFSILPAFMAALNLRGWAGEVFVIGVRLLVFYATRELLIHLLWNVLRDQLNPDPAEARWLLRGRRGSAAAR